jgi:hypothetical protein
MTHQQLGKRQCHGYVVLFFVFPFLVIVAVNGVLVRGLATVPPFLAPALISVPLSTREVVLWETHGAFPHQTSWSFRDNIR